MSTDKGYENLRPCPGFPYLMADDESTQDPLCTEPHYDGMQPCFMCAGLRQARVEGIQTRGKRQGMSIGWCRSCRQGRCEDCWIMCGHDCDQLEEEDDE